MSGNLFFLPVNTGFYEKGVPTVECINFYSSRCNNDTYCGIVGNISTIRGKGTNENTGRISRSGEWDRLADVIESNGTKPGIQISRTWQGYVGQRKFVNERWKDYKTHIVPLLAQTNLREVLDDFIESVYVAAVKGFKHIQIHAAHGYLLSSLLDPDLYSAPEKALDVLKEIRNNFIGKVEFSVRVSTYCGLEPAAEIRRSEILASIYENLYEYVDLSEGYYNFDKSYIYPASTYLKRRRISRSLQVAGKYNSQDFIISGWENPLQQCAPNAHKGFCRHIIANPRFATDVIPLCNYCGGCHYYSLGLKSLTCSQWKKTSSSIK